MGSDLVTGDVEPSSLGTISEDPALPQPLTRICLCQQGLAGYQVRVCTSSAHLECVLPGKALFAVTAGEGLNREMYPLMPFQIVISVETLRTLIAFERTLIVIRLLLVPIQLLHMRGMSTIESRHHTAREASYECQLTSWAMHIGHCRAG